MGLHAEVPKQARQSISERLDYLEKSLDERNRGVLQEVERLAQRVILENKVG